MALRDRRFLTREQVLAWNEKWSAADRLRIATALDVIPSTEYYSPPSGGYIGVEIYGNLESRDHSTFAFQASRAGWYNAMTIHRGYLEWPYGKWTEKLDRRLFAGIQDSERVVFGYFKYFEWLPLSTLGRSGPRAAARPEPQLLLCPNCNTELPATGTCDWC